MSAPDRRAALDALASDLRDRLLTEAQDAGSGPPQPAAERIRALVDREAAVLAHRDREELVRLVAERSFGLGPLEPLLADPAVDEIMVNGPGAVWVERAGRLQATDVRFEDAVALSHAIERILAPLGRRVDAAEPLCDARLPDGSRINVVISPLALDGPVLTIRRFRHAGFTAEQLVQSGTWSAPLAAFLRCAVRARLNVLVCGGTGSGKTTTLNALSSFIGADERVVTIEDTAELRLQQPHVVRLEARPPNVEGRGEVTIRRLVRNALRMRPDRIIVGEVRGAEALDMLGAMATGHDGSLCTVHAGSPEEALRRLETLALMADVGLPHAVVREQVAQAIDLVVQLARAPGGERRAVGVSEVVRVAAGPATREVYAIRDGRPLWRVPLSEGLTARLGPELALEARP
jgi:pilus assembly protein CpaF